MYAFVQKSGQNAIIIFRFYDLERAVDVIRKAGVRVLEGEEVYVI